MDDLDDYNEAPPPPNRVLEVELNGSEIITIELDTLDADPRDYIDLLIEGNVRASVWARLACEYWKKGLLDAAVMCANDALRHFSSQGQTSSLPLLYQLLASVELARARKAPKIIIEHPRQDDMRKEKTKEAYFQLAAQHLNSGDGASREAGDKHVINAMLTRGIYHLARAELDDAFRSFDVVLEAKPTSIIALLGKARIAYARKQYSQSLRLFQQVLTLKPDAQPDPRIGIGLCLWSMDKKAQAKACWERSQEVNPKNWATSLLLGIVEINNSKNTDEEDEDRKASLIKGTKYCERAFNGNNRNAAAANALFDFFLQKRDKKRALKLAERTIQFAETLTLLSAGHIHAGYLAQIDGSHADALRHYGTALKSNPKNLLAAIGLAQVQLKQDELPAAIRTLDNLMQPPNQQRCLEAQVMLASLRTFPRPGVTAADAEAERTKARALFDDILRLLDLHVPAGANTNGRTYTKQVAYERQKAAAILGDDVGMFVEAARLWQNDDLPKMQRLLSEAVRIVDARVQSDNTLKPRLLNNLAVLKHTEGDVSSARGLYENALTVASGLGATEGESMATTILYNLAIAYEDQHESIIAKEAYDKLLNRHPEYVDARVRQAQLQVTLSQYDDAHELLKAAAKSQPANLNVRGALTQFLIARNQPRLAKEVLTVTLRDHKGMEDVYTLCAAAWIYFTEGRENRDASPAGTAEKRKQFSRAVDFYIRALSIDPRCAVAAQGLAIVSAEDLLPLGQTVRSGSESQRRVQAASEALDIFGKVRECLNDSSVYVNMGHCYILRDELDRAIESYETAAKRSSAVRGIDLTIEHCLQRAWYAKANKEQSYPALQKALIYAQRAVHLAPYDKAAVYNMAMIEQKAAEMVLALPQTKRSLKDLKRVVELGTHAQKVFGSLADEKSGSVPYSKDVADQRRKYGETLLRRSDEQMAAQTEYEAAMEARIAEAKQRRLNEKLRLEEAERAKEEELAKQAAILAEARKKAREEAQQWTAAFIGDSDDEKEKRPRKKKQQQQREVGSGDELPATQNGEGKKKRKGKLKKDKAPSEDGVSGDEEEALFSGEDAEERPKKRSQKKRVVRDDDEEVAASAPRSKKQFKSKEMLSDTDEEMS